MLYTEYWALECEEFRGGWILADVGEGHSDDELRVCVARLAVVRVVANALGRQLRGEDLRDDVAMTRAYVAQLEIEAARRRGLLRVLDALTPFDPVALAEALLSECAAAGRASLDGSARSLAELAYDVALGHDLHACAQGAALALSRLAALQECPRSARKWQALSYMHRRRAVVSCGMTSYTRAQRVALEKAVKEKAALVCPECGGRMTQQAVVPAANVPYVRHRVWVMCMDCRRSASLDT